MVVTDMNKTTFVEKFVRIVLLVQENCKTMLGSCRNHLTCVSLGPSYQLVTWSILCELINLQLYLVHLTTKMYCYLVTQHYTCNYLFNTFTTRPFSDIVVVSIIHFHLHNGYDMELQYQYDETL